MLDRNVAMRTDTNLFILYYRFSRENGQKTGKVLFRISLELQRPTSLYAKTT